MVDQVEKLRKIAEQRTIKPRKQVRLGEVITEFIEQQVSPRQRRFEAITEAWKTLLPVALSRHCRILDIEAGQMKVTVDSPVYMHELRLCSSELISRLQQQCPEGRIKKIKFCIR